MAVRWVNEPRVVRARTTPPDDFERKFIDAGSKFVAPLCEVIADSVVTLPVIERSMFSTESMVAHPLFPRFDSVPGPVRLHCEHESEVGGASAPYR